MSKIDERLLHSNMQEKQENSTVLGRSEIIRIFVFEMIGTFILAFGIACSQFTPPLSKKIQNPFHDIFVSLSLYTAIVLCAPFSGGHFNPSVTFGFFVLKDQAMSVGKLLTYLLGQILGAASGVALAKSIFDISVTPYAHPVQFFSVIGHSIGEFMGGFLFIFMILAVVCKETTFINEAAWVHIFIPISLFVARSFSFHVGGVNPTVVSSFQIGSILSQNVKVQDGGLVMIQILVLDLASILGACVASWFYQKVYRPTFPKND